MRRKKVIIVDDDHRFRDPLEGFLSREAVVVTFDDPDAFAQAYKNPSDLLDVYLIVLDFRFDSYNALDKDLVSYLREDLEYRGKVVLWSLEDSVPMEFSRRLKAVLPKKLLSLGEIEQCLEKC